MQSSGFDFSNAHEIEFNVDFSAWPPAEEFLHALHAKFPRIRLYRPGESFNGYVQFVVNAKLTYELVMETQHTVSGLASPYGGICESWGVMQD
jgi:hypothetical protein